MTLLFPSKHALGELIAAESVAAARSREAANEQHVLVELLAWNLEVERVSDAMRKKHSFRAYS